jgi:hypothetical protein
LINSLCNQITKPCYFIFPCEIAWICQPELLHNELLILVVFFKVWLRSFLCNLVDGHVQDTDCSMQCNSQTGSGILDWVMEFPWALCSAVIKTSRQVWSNLATTHNFDSSWRQSLELSKYRTLQKQKRISSWAKKLRKPKNLISKGWAFWKM